MLNKREADKQHDAPVIKRGGGKHDEDEHGGAWKVAFADFCLALLCLFLVLWLLAARQTENLQEVMRSYGGNLIDDGQGRMLDQAAGPRGSLIDRNPLPSEGDTQAQRKAQANSTQVVEETDQGIRLGKNRLETRADLQELALLLERMGEQAGLAGHVQTVVTPYGLRVMLHDTERQGMFQLGGSAPSDRFRDLLRKMGPLFGQIENQMLIVGHTDSLQYAGGDKSLFSNWTLSNNRAMTARAQLMEGGMPARSVLQVVGMADRAPLDPKNTAAAVNRRIELLILTPSHANAISAMFGEPDADMQPLAQGVSAGLPPTPGERTELGAMRQQLQPTTTR